jgi:type I restriction enzyme S subunit
MLNLNSSILSDLPILLPSLSSQRQITSILKSLDDKIEVNRKINGNLEQQAQALFKSWFVDFEPFKKQPFVNSELGMIPQGWRVNKLGDVCKCILGGTPSRDKEEYWNGDIAWINSGEVNKFRITTPSEYITEEGLKNSATKLLPRKTTVLAITGATLGQVSLLEIESCANQSVIGVLENSDYPYVFIYPLIKERIGELM